MISRLRGTILGVENGVAEARVAGVTYALKVGAQTAEEIGGSLGAEIEFFVHMAVSEAGTTLYGFLLEAERAAFRRLLKVSRVGPALAQKILEGVTPAELEVAIAAGDVARLERVKGVGEKLARLIMVQLSDKPKREKGKGAG